MPQLYTKRGGTIPDDVYLFEIDTLYVLTKRWGEPMFKFNRDKLYQLMSGTCEEEKYRNIFESMYIRYIQFTNDVDSICSFEENPDLIAKMILPARNMINRYADKIMSELRAKKCNILMQTHDYIYVSSKEDISESYNSVRRIL